MLFKVLKLESHLLERIYIFQKRKSYPAVMKLEVRFMTSINRLAFSKHPISS